MNTWFAHAQALIERLEGVFAGGVQLEKSTVPEPGGRGGALRATLPRATIDMLGSDTQNGEDPVGFYKPNSEFTIRMVLARRQDDPKSDLQIVTEAVTKLHVALHGGPSGRDLEVEGFEDLRWKGFDILFNADDQELEVSYDLEIVHIFPVDDPARTADTW